MNEDTYEKIDDKTFKVVKNLPPEEHIYDIDTLKLEVENLDRQIADIQERSARDIQERTDRKTELLKVIAKANDVGVLNDE